MNPKIGRNDPCWCGSGRKYKKCHLSRMQERELPPQALLGHFRKFFKVKQRLHPLASSKTCGKVVSAHTIQRKGALEGVVGETGHCLSSLMTGATRQSLNVEVGRRLRHLLVSVIGTTG